MHFLKEIMVVDATGNWMKLGPFGSHSGLCQDSKLHPRFWESPTTTTSSTEVQGVVVGLKFHHNQRQIFGRQVSIPQRFGYVLDLRTLWAAEPSMHRKKRKHNCPWNILQTPQNMAQNGSIPCHGKVYRDYLPTKHFVCLPVVSCLSALQFAVTKPVPLTHRFGGNKWGSWVQQTFGDMMWIKRWMLVDVRKSQVCQ